MEILNTFVQYVAHQNAQTLVAATNTSKGCRYIMLVKYDLSVDTWSCCVLHLHQLMCQVHTRY